MQGIARHNFKKPAPYLVTASALSALAWSATSKSGSIILSNGNLTETATGAGADVIGRTDSGISGSQLVYYENHIDAVVTTHPGNGLMNATEVFNHFLGQTADSLGYFTTGQVFNNGSQIATLAAYTTGATIGSAIDAAHSHIWWTLDGLTFNNDIIANQNPVGNIGGIAIPAGTVFPAYNSFDTDQSTVNFGETTFAYATLFATLQAAGYTVLQ